MIKWNEKFFKEFNKAQQLALKKTGIYLETQIKKEVKEKAYDTGDFLRSINSRLKGNDTVRVGSNRIQAWIMEYGRKPHSKMPPLDALVGWAGRHGFHKDGRTKPYNALNTKAKQAVYVLARSIARKGIKPRRIFRDTLQKEAKNLIKKYQRYLKDYLK